MSSNIIFAVVILLFLIIILPNGFAFSLGLTTGALLYKLLLSN